MSRFLQSAGVGWRLTMRAVRAAVMFGLVVAAVVGLPWVLVVATRGLWQSDPDWAGLVDAPLSALGVAFAGLLAGWAVWLWLLVTAILDTADMVRRPHRPSRRLPVPLHTAVTAVAGSVVLLVDAVTGRGAGTAAPGPVSPPATVAAGVAAPMPTPPGEPVQGMAVPAAAPVAVDARAAVDFTMAGVQLRGGWLPLPVVVVVAAATALMWAQRRRDYRPRPPGRADRDDADLAPADPALAALDVLPDLDTAVPDRDGTDEMSVIIGVAGDRWLDLTAVPHDGVGLAGEGALDAARGLLVATLTSVAAHGDGPQVVMYRSTARTLFGGEPSVPGLHLRADAIPGAVPSGAASLGSEVGRPAVSILVGTPAADTVGSTGAVPDPPQLQVTVIDGHAGSAGTTWTVDADGIIAGGPPGRGHQPVQRARLATLSLPTATALLVTLRQTSAAGRPRTASTGGTGDTAASTALPGAARSPHAAPGVTSVPWPDRPPADAHRPRRLLVGVLGPVQVLLPRPDGTYTAVEIRRTASQHLLVLLAVHRDGVTSNDLKEALWPDVAGKSAARRFATSMSALHTALRDAAGGDVVRRTTAPSAGGGRFWLDPDRVQVDLWQFHDLLDTAAIHSSDPAGRHQLLRDAVALERGELADRLPDGPAMGWLAVYRERTSRHLIDCYLHLADLEPDPGTALQLLRRAIYLAPHTERLYRAAMTQQAAVGDHDGVRRTMATLTERLAELRATPEPATVRLYGELLHDVAASTAPEQGRT